MESHAFAFAFAFCLCVFEPMAEAEERSQEYAQHDVTQAPLSFALFGHASLLTPCPSAGSSPSLVVVARVGPIAILALAALQLF